MATLVAAARWRAQIDLLAAVYCIPSMVAGFLLFAFGSRRSSPAKTAKIAQPAGVWQFTAETPQRRAYRREHCVCRRDGAFRAAGRQ